MAQENVVVVRFEETVRAHEALAVLRKCDADERINLKSAAVVRRDASTGDLHILEDAENVGPVGMASGSLLGMLIGVLGGPVGVLLGWGAGATVGGVFDIDRAVTSDEAITVLGTAIPVGAAAVLADVEEPAVEVIDGEMKKLDGAVIRRPVGEVMAELGAAEEAADAAAREARRTIREKRKAEFQASFEEHKDKLKEKLHA